MRVGWEVPGSLTGSNGGDTASTEVKSRGMHAEVHLPRKSGGTNITADTQLALAA
jgi:hypothetical protein